MLLSPDPTARSTAAAALDSEYFTTAPYACEPASLPKYPPNKEMDAKFREESRRYAALCCNTEVMPCHCQEEQPPAISKRPDDGDHAAPCARTIASLGRARAYAPIKSGRQLLQTPTYVVQARLGLPPPQLLWPSTLATMRRVDPLRRLPHVVRAAIRPSRVHFVVLRALRLAVVRAGAQRRVPPLF